MISKSGFWQTKDNCKLFFQKWMPDSSPTALVCLVHGIGEHCGRYLNLAQNLVDNNFAVYSIDLRGHGRSDGVRGDVRNYTLFFDDLELLVRAARDENPDLPLILYGHSMGGNIALSFFMEKRITIQAMIITSPWITLSHNIPILKLAAGKLAYLLLPSLVQPNGLITEYLSHDIEEVKKYEQDSLVHNKISVRLFFNASKAGLKILSKAKQINIPTLLMHGTDDKITSCGSSEKLAAMNPANIHLKLWTGFYHELHNETSRQDVINYLTDWIKKQI